MQKSDKEPRWTKYEDTKHRDSIGEPRTFELFTAQLYDRMRHGEDRLRVVGHRQLKDQIQDVLNAESGRVRDDARARCLQLPQERKRPCTFLGRMGRPQRGC